MNKINILKLVIATVISIFIFTGCGQPKPKEPYETSETPTKNGKIHGTKKTYKVYPTGSKAYPEGKKNLISTTEYVNGKKHGYYREYSTVTILPGYYGKVYLEAEYKNDQLDGELKRWDGGLHTGKKPFTELTDRQYYKKGKRVNKDGTPYVKKTKKTKKSSGPMYTQKQMDTMTNKACRYVKNYFVGPGAKTPREQEKFRNAKHICKYGWKPGISPSFY